MFDIIFLFLLSMTPTLFFLILFIAIIFILIKLSSANKISKLLEECGYKNVETVFTASTYTIYQAIINGDYCAILVPENSYHITQAMVENLEKFRKTNHIHNQIIITYNKLDNYDKSITKDIKIYSLEQLLQSINLDESTDNINKNLNFQIGKIIYTKTLDDNCKIDSSFDPIQNSDNTSFLKRLFNRNKIDRL